MKRFFTILLTLIVTASVLLPQQASAQSPQRMSYQAVIRNSSNALVTNTNVGMQISILQGSGTGTAVYSETQTPVTNENGMVRIEIGNGAGFNEIAWANGPYFIKTETDPTGGTNYTISGTSELLSVPYALYAGTLGDRANVIVYSKLEGWVLVGNYAIYSYWTCNYDGTNNKQIDIVFPDDTFAVCNNPKLSPDGKTVFFTLVTGNGNGLCAIYSCSIDGSNLTKIMEIENHNNGGGQFEIGGVY